MPHSYVSCHIHYVFSTKERRQIITPDLKERLWAYMGGIARQNGMKALETGGSENHVHALLGLPSTIMVAKAVQLIKGGSSKWVSDTLPSHRDFEWQQGYGAFSVGVGGIEKTIAYIRSQPEHHRKETFEEEFIVFLKRHGVAYDERYVWG